VALLDGDESRSSGGHDLVDIKVRSGDLNDLDPFTQQAASEDESSWQLAGKLSYC